MSIGSSVNSGETVSAFRISGALPVRTVKLGTLPEERHQPQTIFLDLEIEIDLAAASLSDDLYDTIDYSDIEQKMVVLAEKSKFFGIEKVIWCT